MEEGSEVSDLTGWPSVDVKLSTMSCVGGLGDPHEIMERRKKRTTDFFMYAGFLVNKMAYNVRKNQ
ncbi:hypothetical protein MASR1M31_04630 [Porphyromonadaceae bacterium]